MNDPYLCPKCKTNRTRFHRIVQQVEPVKLSPQTGEIVETYSEDSLDVFHMPYKGPSIRIQCGACGLNEAEDTFVAFARNNQFQ
ncbi:DNA alkylation repair protein [Shouchella clausii]|uniref:DNA alkylation repair protein n=1 Tax=Shouchella clausii TaxID=79880 RepID=UPI000BA7280D|nr:DNA alkylation repair protein [Shouchella clausii]PAE94996.1 DNA alkylation repair protein [Shouchella clausii]